MQRVQCNSHPRDANRVAAFTAWQVATLGDYGTDDVARRLRCSEGSSGTACSPEIMPSPSARSRSKSLGVGLGTDRNAGLLSPGR